MAPLPTTQVGVLMGVRLAEPIAYVVIFPFINEMVEHMGVTHDPNRVGFYSGLVESAFAFVQFFTVYHWAKLSDNIGRKPVILCGLLGVAVSIAGFGLATSFWAALFLRCLAGAWSGNVAVIKASLGDITDDSNATDAFALYGLTWTIGGILGNALGGGLAHPAELWPGIFQAPVWAKHPYFLPCLVAASTTVVGIIFAAAMYTESLDGLAGTSEATLVGGLTALVKGKRRHTRSMSAYSDISDAETLVDPRDGDMGGVGLAMKRLHDEYEEEEELVEMGIRTEWTLKELLRIRQVRVANGALFLNSFVAGSWSAVSLLFFYDRHNGLGMSASAIGAALAINGVWTIVCQLAFLTRLRRALGLARAYQVLTAGWLPVWALLPLLRPLLEAVEVPGPDGLYPKQRGWIVSIAVNVFLSLVTVVTINTSLLMVIVNDSAPDRTALGGVNGISTAVGSMARVVGPSLVSALFAISMSSNVLGGRLWWVFMVVVSALNLAAAFRVSDKRVLQV
ncbi:hypothetical protein CcaverHIS002_0202940 [Cutaneotrichosporon cavernicola]|uniref:Major facilitator superfamily (MFS) profile domain-containing protein n=1 Tax=Cutaneotrichosporon cavernicola TaxID=279322 RepID=A0AA48IF62_9TREE|nr:uncharacterized protein CcaverHIS019_0202950 [Cutaneotrichosporon cavernicola]BEI81134.1 hypothetical protein CcaverHIS002_0202940 [Cutaneotrichosporon cavernicola]BEI88933.1 hypothetical protein CcaverHIS019_0202950 [Cutaneotrichosporon cavernicola]BEI96710.1 hypothetical protein CcaverHIS631_0202990 [Cutaneotrichosporon cavernicola]BEJ04482.1 hypothetical protein CcaverHIS641_0202990 [Cutaneotrichosporon cavernicola]